MKIPDYISDEVLLGSSNGSHDKPFLSFDIFDIFTLNVKHCLQPTHIYSVYSCADSSKCGGCLEATVPQCMWILLLQSLWKDGVWCRHLGREPLGSKYGLGADNMALGLGITDTKPDNIEIWILRCHYINVNHDGFNPIQVSG